MSAPPALTDETSSHPRVASVWLWLFGAVLIACSLMFLVMTRQWPMVGDAALLRYTVFLIRHGWAPYRDFVDINMPGAYWATAFGMGLADSANASWRIFDLGLIALTGVSYFVIARPYSRFAALFATAMLLLVHGQDGVQQAGQRDLVIAALLVMAVAFLLEAVRRDRWWYLVPFGLAVGLGATIKPTAGPLGVVLLVMAATHRAGLWEVARGGEARRSHEPAHPRGWLNWTLIGIAAMALPLAAMLLWLAHKGALDAWLATERVLLPYYASLDRQSLGHSLAHSISPLEPLAGLWLVCAVLRGPVWLRFERMLVGAAVLLSLLALLAQAKPLPYQRYPLLAFLLLLVALDLTTAWQARGEVKRKIPRYIALAGLGYGCLVMAPRALFRIHRFVAQPQEFDAMLAADLRQVGGDLNRRVQCIDTINECLPTLDTMGLEPATGVLYDLYLFGPEKQPAVVQVRQRFLNAVEARPPAVFVVVSGFFLEGMSGYQKLDTWPAFEQWLDAHYTLAAERTPPHLVRWWGRAQPPSGYRLYVLNQVPKPRAAAFEIPLR
jgi:Dolichyl-phosphate-mannose-protein mannosyltransferase